MNRGRREDVARLAGHGKFLDDIRLPGCLHCAFVRSQRAHARVRLDVRPRRGQAVFTRADFPELREVPVILGHDEVPQILSQTASLTQRHTPQPIFGGPEVRFAGEIVAAVVAESVALAEDALAACEPTYTDLPVATDPFAAQEPGSPQLHIEAPRNRTVELRMTSGDATRALAQAEVVFEETFRFGRQSPLPLEGRGIVASWDDAQQRLTIWSSTQIPHALRGAISDALGLSQRDIHVITPDVGGGFGTKALVYPEELIVAALAVRLRRPIKWCEDRLQHLASAIHGRDQVHHIAIGATSQGQLVVLKDDFVVDTGAYDLFGKSVPYNCAAHVLGPYRIPNVDISGTQVVTNKTPCAPYRGSGRPEATFARERAIDALAYQLRMDPLELRRRNLIDSRDMPFDTGLLYRDGAPLVYDYGDYAGCLDDAMKLAASSSASPPAEGIIRSTGVACFVQSGGKGPWETAMVEVSGDGKVLIATGAVSQGQAHETVWAKLCSDIIEGVGPEDCMVRQGDTDVIAEGWGTMASRSAVNAGNALRSASCDLRQQLDRLALELAGMGDQARVSVRNREWVVVGRDAAERRFSLQDLLREAHPAHRDVVRPRAEAVYRPDTVGWAFSAHVATVDLDPETGMLKLVDYVAAYDNGRLLDEEVVDEQMIGGIMQGISGALTEEIVYDDQGQLQTATLSDYGISTADEGPARLVTTKRCTPTDRNPLGVKGVGEAGIVGPAAAIGNAVSAALEPLGVCITEAPITPEAVFRLLGGRRPEAAALAAGS